MARYLWLSIQQQALGQGNSGWFSVNASLNAEPMYAHFGFECTGDVKTQQGVRFVPMHYSIPSKDATLGKHPCQSI